MKEEQIARFFVSANSGKGFYSLYDKVFQNDLFDKIFIIHGGPGTGKSTLMRQIAEAGEEIGASREEILCSSDPTSLDGIILSYQGKRIAVLDGTLPHPRNIAMPAVKEELWNLGSFWDAEKISESREKIISFSKEKKKSYQQAYSLLRAADCCHTELYHQYEELVNIEKLAAHIARSLNKVSKKGEAKEGFIHAYSMCGEYIENSILNRYKNIALLCGKACAAQIYLSFFENFLSKEQVEHTFFRSPLSPELLDGIYVSESDTLYLWEGLASKHSNGKRIHLDRFFDKEKTPESKNNAKELAGLEKALLAAALSSLKKAGRAHFSLEDVYKSAMDFRLMKQQAEKWKKETLHILKSGK